MIRPGEAQREEKSRKVSAVAHEEELKRSERIVQAEENAEDAEYVEPTSEESAARAQNVKPHAKGGRKRRR
jgi:hypothetical protein